MKPEDLNALGAIYFENLSQGLQNPERYLFETRRMDGQAACRAVRERWEALGRERAFCDFYYFRLEQEARERVESVLTEDERKYLEKLGKGSPADEIIFPLDEKLLPIAARLNETEMLFSTFYFTGPVEERSIWWGNYHQEYLIFRERPYVRPYVKK